MSVFVEFFDAGDNPLGHYWLNHADPTERACLGMRCADILKEGGAVYTARVSKHGVFP